MGELENFIRKCTPDEREFLKMCANEFRDKSSELICLTRICPWCSMRHICKTFRQIKSIIDDIQDEDYIKSMMEENK